MEGGKFKLAIAGFGALALAVVYDVNYIGDIVRHPGNYIKYYLAGIHFGPTGRQKSIEEAMFLAAKPLKDVPENLSCDKLNMYEKKIAQYKHGLRKYKTPCTLSRECLQIYRLATVYLLGEKQRNQLKLRHVLAQIGKHCQVPHMVLHASICYTATNYMRDAQRCGVHGFRMSRINRIASHHCTFLYY